MMGLKIFKKYNYLYNCIACLSVKLNILKIYLTSSLSLLYITMKNNEQFLL